MVPYLIGLSVAIGFAWLAVHGIRRWAERNLLDIPNERSSHTRPVPRGGGAAIVLVVVVGWAALVARTFSPSVAWLAVGGLLIAGISWLDDLYTLSSRVRFGVHALAVALPMVALGYWEALALPLVGTVAVGALGMGLVLLWGVGLTNAYNFMDGIDGIAAVQAIAAGAGWLIAGWLMGAPVVAWTGGLAAAGALGFLPHNWSPARIFMGDVGSAFLGYVFAMLALAAYHAAPSPEQAARVPLAALAFVWPFVFDAVFTFIRRLKNRENVFAAHRSHLYQRLVISGRSHAQVSMLYGVLALASTLAGLAWLFHWTGGSGIVVLVLLGEALALVGWTHRQEQAVARAPS